MKKLICLLLALVMVLGLVACGNDAPAADAPAADAPAADAPAADAPAADAPAADAPAADAPAAEKNMDLSILWSATGNGEMANEAVKMLEEEYGLNISLEYNTVAHEVFQPMLVAGNPPDIVMVQDNFFNHFEAIQSGAYNSFTQYLDLPVSEDGTTIHDVANTDMLDALAVDGEYYLAITNVNIAGMYYDKTMFTEHGWEVPETWDEFMALCETIKTTTDIAPFAYTGMYPYYFDCFFFPLICSIGDGLETWKGYNNLEEGWWTSEPVMEAAKRVQEIRDKGYFPEGMMSMNHTGSQMEFINGNIAMICVGSWLDAEMDGNWTEDFDLSFMQTPIDKAGGDKFISGSGQMYVFPAAAANQDWIGEFMQAYYSEQSAIYNAGNGCVISPYYVANSADVAAALSEPEAETFAAANEAINLTNLVKRWYKELYNEYQNNIAALTAGEIDAEEFCQTMEALAEQVRNDDSITKYVAS